MLPPPWERHFSEEDEQYYYFHPETEQCLWETDLLEFLHEEGLMESEGTYVEGNEYEDEGVERALFQDEAAVEEDDFDGFDLQSLANMDMDNGTDTGSVYAGISSSELNVVERSRLTQQAKQLKINSLRQSKEREELMSISKPTTTKKAQGMQRSVEDMIQWDEQRRARIHRSKQAIRSQEDAENTGRPVLSKLAEQLARRRQLEESSDLGSVAVESTDGQTVVSGVSFGGRSVQDRLYEYEERKKEKLQRLQAAKETAIRQAAVPKIAPMSNRILARKYGGSGGGDGNSVNETSTSAESHVSERLYALAQIRSTTRFLPSGHLTQHDELTGQRLFEVSKYPCTCFVFGLNILLSCFSRS